MKSFSGAVDRKLFKTINTGYKLWFVCPVDQCGCHILFQCSIRDRPKQVARERETNRGIKGHCQIRHKDISQSKEFPKVNITNFEGDEDATGRRGLFMCEFPPFPLISLSHHT